MNSERMADLARRARAYAALGDVHRLQVLDLLAVSDASSSELAAALAIPSNLLAHHLRILEDAGLVTRRRSEGDARRTYVSLNRTHHWLAATQAPTGIVLPKAGRVVFVCTANTARSHLAAALWRSASPVDATSAGTHPGERVDRGALTAARRHHLDLPDIPPRSLDEVVAEGDLVITVCDRAHEELGGLARVHWSIPDPVPTGTRAAFDAAHDALAERIEALAPALA